MTFDMTTERVTDAERALAEELGTTNLHLVRYLGRLTERVEYLEAMVVRLQDGALATYRAGRPAEERD
jgi:hypothetical protein